MSKNQNGDPEPLKTVLIAHRDPMLVHDLTKNCERMGLNVITAIDAASVVKIMDGRFPDLLIFDYGLPVNDGETFLEIWATHKECTQVPAIILCGTDDLNSVRRFSDVYGYYCRRDANLWKNVEMFIQELVDLTPCGIDEPTTNPTCKNLKKGETL